MRGREQCLAVLAGACHRSIRTGFSLAELVIIVVIIGIIAAIAIPRISSGSASSGEVALRGNLRALRDAIDRYAAEHLGDLPGSKADGLGNAANTGAAMVNQLTQYSDAVGNVSADSTPNHPFGPYLHRIPRLPVGGNRGESGVVIDAANSPPLVAISANGWVYNPITGEIIANSDDANQDGSLTYDEY